MNRITIAMASAMLLFSNCKYYEIFHAASTSPGINTDSRYYTYNNGTLRIAYDFWDHGGIMRFTVYNTSKKPI